MASTQMGTGRSALHERMIAAGWSPDEIEALESAMERDGSRAGTAVSATPRSGRKA